MTPITKCNRCNQYGNNKLEWATVRGTKAVRESCEFCGWKVRR